MLSSQIPAKFSVAWASGAASQYIRQIPVQSQIGVTTGRASYTDGFVPASFVPVTNGGTPPAGKDFNGIFNAITLWLQWQCAGGMPSFDAAFCTAVGGYPQGALLASTTPGQIWLNLTDANATNPDAQGAANWTSIPTAAGIQSGRYVYGDDSGTQNALVITPQTPFQALSRGTVVRTRPLTDCTGAATANVSGIGARPIVQTGGAALNALAYRAGDVIDLHYDGSSFYLHGATGSGTASLLSRAICYVADTGTADAITGPGSPSPSAYTAGQMFLVMKAGADNATATPTLAVGTLPARTIFTAKGAALAASDLPANAPFLVEYDATLNGFRYIGKTASDVQALAAASSAAVLDGGCYISVLDTTHVQVLPKNGNTVFVNGAPVTIPNAGLSIGNASGGTALAANTLYNLYLIGPSSAPTLEWSTTGYAVDAIGRKYKSGDQTRRWLGAITTNASAQFQNSGLFFGVLNAFNRQPVLIDSGWSAVTTIGSGTTVSMGNLVTVMTGVEEEIEVDTIIKSVPHSGSNVGSNGMVTTCIDGANAGITYDYNVAAASGNPPDTFNIAIYRSQLADGRHTIQANVTGGSANTTYGTDFTIRQLIRTRG